MLRREQTFSNTWPNCQIYIIDPNAMQYFNMIPLKFDGFSIIKMNITINKQTFNSRSVSSYA